MQMKQVFQHLKKPPLYSPSTSAFWDDAHISKGMLEAHLHPTWDAASRSHAFIDRSVEWIARVAPPENYPRLLDLGCGPGLYAGRFHRKGYQVTGVDFSRRSIAYAKEQDPDIDFFYQNYLEMNYEGAYDLVTLIFCDYSVLSDENRATLMERIYRALKPGGKLVFDVFTHRHFEDCDELKTWGLQEQGGFWKPGPYLHLESHDIYSEDVRLDQHVICDEQGQVDVIRNWFRSFTPESLLEETRAVGFASHEFYGDVSGTPYTQSSKTLCFIVEK